MFRRRQKKRTLIRSACGQMIEPLEKRVLLTTINDFGLPTVQTLEYKDASGGAVRVAYYNVKADLAFANVTTKHPKKAVLYNTFVPASAASSVPGMDLFSIYVEQSTVYSYISIARVPATTEKTRPMQPFTGNIALNVINAQDHTKIAGVTVGVGDILLGTRTLETGTDATTANQPIIQTKYFIGPISDFPAAKKNGKLMAGLTVAPGQDLGKFLFGGTVLGSVYVPSGSMDTFYCGSLLTGYALGQYGAGTLSPSATGGGPGEPIIPNNFYIGGDLRNLIVMGSIGTDTAQSDPTKPIYIAGTDIEIHGRSNQIRSFDTILAKTWVWNDPAAPGIHTMQYEIGVRDNLPKDAATDFENGNLGDGQANFDHITFDTPQFLGVWNTSKLGDQAIQVTGSILSDPGKPDNNLVDYYALPLMGGQTITVRLIDQIGFAQVGVYDPNQRLVATNYPINKMQGSPNGAIGVFNNTANSRSPINNEDPFQFTATEPGIYRFAIGRFGGTVTVDGASVNAGFTGLSQLGTNYGDTYQLQITGAGNLGLGALAATNLIFNETNTEFGGVLIPPADPSALVVNGDFGAVWVGTGSIVYNSVTGKPDIEAHGGNLRAIDAPQIGKVSAADTTSGGAANDTGPTYTNGQEFLANRGNIGVIRARTGQIIADSIVAKQYKANGIGGDIQLIQAPNGFFYGNIYADRSLGTLSADNMGTRVPSTITVNADKRRSHNGAIDPQDGVIDLIDIKNNMGIPTYGGPVIVTNGGNVRYMRAGQAYRDRYFGGGTPETTTFVQGQSATFTDDSGSQIKITPSQAVLDPLTGATLTPAGTLTVTTYPIRSGGVVIMDVQSTQGLTTYANAVGTGGSVEIGRIESNGQAAPLVPVPLSQTETGTADQPLQLDPNSLLNNSIVMKGSLTDVLEIDGSQGFNEVSNRTGGEIVSTAITGSVGLIESGTLGIARNSTGAAIQPLVIAPNAVADDSALGITAGIANTYPFRGQHTGIMIKGDVATARSSLGLGNLMVDGRIDKVVANLDGHLVHGVFEGINAPVFSTGNIDSVNIGEGVLPSGTGDPSRSGIYAEGRIGTVFNQGLGSDIRGAIVSTQNIGTISLQDGAIIGATIGVIAGSSLTAVPSSSTNTGEDMAGASVLPYHHLIYSGTDSNGLPIGEISHTGLSGEGGIIGARFIIANLGPVEVRNGFGIFNTEFDLTGTSRTYPITADGYGIRNCYFFGGAYAVGFNARANGSYLNTNSYTPSVRMAQHYKFDPYSGIAVNSFSDLYYALGTSPKQPIRHATSYGGAIEDSVFVASRDLGSMTANSMKNDIVNFGNNITTISARSTISALNVTAGSLATLSTGGMMEKSQFTISGPIGNVHIGATFRGSNTIVAQGPNGTIGSFVTDGSLFGNLAASTGINAIRVGFDVGSFDVHTGGNLGQFIVNGSILTGANVSCDKTISQLVIGGDVQIGASVTARDILHKDIAGQVYGTVTP